MKRSYIIGLLLIAASIIIIVSSIGNTSQYVSFNEAIAHPGPKYHVIGLWDKEKGMEYNPKKNPNYFSFYLKDSTNVEKKVVYHKDKPAEFEHSEKIVIVGEMVGDDFVASDILMKCPSKYNADKPKLQSNLSE